MAYVARQGKAVGGGLSVSLNGHLFKVKADYRCRFGDIVARGLHVARLQLDASF